MSPLFEIIGREIVRHGALPFARFMELALYCPKHGYYETNKDNPGRHGDFYTSVGTGEIFGRLLAFQFAGWLEELRIVECELRIVEAGAHDARLAADILGWLRLKRPELFGQIEYWILEPSVQRQEWQRETLKDFIPHVRWFDDFRSLSFSNPQSAIRNPQLNGVIFSNELLDAMPIHRFGWDAATRTWFEWGVTVEAKKFIWTKIRGSQLPSSIRRLPSSLLEVLPDGYVLETGPTAENWWREAAGILERGKLMTIDYGLTADEWISPDRLGGTLRGYFRHHVSADVLANVGEQDLTAHVNFSCLQTAGESAGLKTESFQTQSQFLTQVLEKALKTDSFGELVASKHSEDGWTAALARQFQSLTHPEHLGRAFRVLTQSR